MHCPGVGAWALPVLYNGPHGGIRRADAVACPFCGKRLAPRKDNTVRKHAPKGRTPAKSVPANPAPIRAARVVTQK